MSALLASLSSDDENVELEKHDDERDDDDVNKDFMFGGILGEDAEDGIDFASQPTGWSYKMALRKLEKEKEGSNIPRRLDISSLIAAKRRALNQDGREAVDATSSDEEDNVSDKIDDDSNATSGDGERSDDVDGAHDTMDNDVVKVVLGEENGNDHDDDAFDQEEAHKAQKFFESVSSEMCGTDEIELFAQLPLSRPLLRGLAAMGYVKPTAIQSAVIPVVLANRDTVANAVTGSGKTAAFLVPILEKLLHRPSGRIQALILAPTRELAAQCFGMISTLAQFTKIRASLIVGGSKNVISQAAELRSQPQLVVCTPGRMLDHVMNSTGVALDDVEFLVLDEADRLLDMGFQDETQELIKSCPVARQTLLFSATMNVRVDDLIKISLKRPVRIRVSNKGSGGTNNDLEVAPRLVQEFVRIRKGNEGLNREAILLSLLTRVFKTGTIVFTETKVKAHRLMILCGLCGIKCTELHGNLTQTQRLEALEQFRTRQVEILLATDLAARGLDIDRVETVVNFEMPSQVETYIHRIGRTARAGRGGRSCTLISEGRRHLMKGILKDAAHKLKDGSDEGSTSGTIRSRSVPLAVIAHFAARIKSLESNLEEVLQAEAVARMDRLADIEASKAQNLIEHSDEIMARPQRQWFASDRERKAVKEATAEKARVMAEKAGTGLHRMSRKKRRAREAIQALQEDIGADEDDEAAVSSHKVTSMKAAARARKREQEQKDMTKQSKSIHDMDVERERSKVKREVAADPLGDSSMFGEEKIAYAAKKSNVGENEHAPSSYHFRGYDPSMDARRKRKKKSVHKFKSKSKYKRR